MSRFLLAFLMLWGTHASAQAYAGPKSLGPFRIDKDVSMNSLFEKLGHPSKAAGDTFCYQSADGHAYLVLTRMVAAYDRKVAGDAELSDFRSCLDKPVQVTSDDLAAWRTEKGIGLGSSSEDVMKAYGKPSSAENIGTDYRAIIHGAPAHSKRKPEVGTTVLGYKGASDDLNAAYFGIRDGKVAWISLSKNE
jgi:hypothetical protein